ncbi:MAG: TadE/TadG family type IV pilus assembly protein [Nitrospiria bacterium]
MKLELKSQKILNVEKGLHARPQTRGAAGVRYGVRRESREARTQQVTLSQQFSNQKGMVVAEWVIVFPLFLFFLLSIAQLGFLIIAKQTVNFAAYASARALLTAEKPAWGNLDSSDVGKKAAALACMGITGLANRTPYLPSTDPDIIHMAGRYSHDSRAHTDFLQRYTAALDKTRINIWYLNGEDSKVKVKVEVLHDYELDFPIVNHLLSSLFSNTSRYGFPHIPIHSTVLLG